MSTINYSIIHSFSHIKYWGFIDLNINSKGHSLLYCYMVIGAKHWLRSSGNSRITNFYVNEKFLLIAKWSQTKWNTLIVVIFILPASFIRSLVENGVVSFFLTKKYMSLSTRRIRLFSPFIGKALPNREKYKKIFTWNSKAHPMASSSFAKHTCVLKL